MTTSSTTTAQSPPSPVLNGQLFLYARGRAAFESPTTSEEKEHCPNKCILVGGLSDGLLPVPYTAALETACVQNNNAWSLVQPILSSSYTGFGHGSLERDTLELNELIHYLLQYRGAERLCLVGHSTGCQNAVHFLKHGDPECISKLYVVALQAPVSDREHAMVDDPDRYNQFLKIAMDLKQQQKAETMMPREAFLAPITAQRYLDLQERGGADDFFSSDYTDEELQNRLRHVGTAPLHTGDGAVRHRRRVLVAFSGADEYVPRTVDTKTLTDRLVQAMNTDCSGADYQVAQGLYLPTAIHNLQNPEDGQTFVNKVGELLADCL